MATALKNPEFDALVSRVQACRMCPRMEGRRRVLGYANGSPDSRVLFVAEAPGRLGAERDGRPLWGDRAGKNFRRLLRLTGLKRTDIFISNAVLCNPQNKDGNNSPPTTREIRNCAGHMKSLLKIMRPEMVVTLGKKALQSLNEVSPHEVDLHRDVAKPLHWNRSTLVPLYHCGQQAMISRPFKKQQEDYRSLKSVLATSPFILSSDPVSSMSLLKDNEDSPPQRVQRGGAFSDGVLGVSPRFKFPLPGKEGGQGDSSHRPGRRQRCQ